MSKKISPFLLKFLFFILHEYFLTVFIRESAAKHESFVKFLTKKSGSFSAAPFSNYKINYFSDELEAKISNNFFVASPELILLQIAYSFANLSKACS